MPSFSSSETRNTAQSSMVFSSVSCIDPLSICYKLRYAYIPANPAIPSEISWSNGVRVTSGKELRLLLCPSLAATGPLCQAAEKRSIKTAGSVQPPRSVQVVAPICEGTARRPVQRMWHDSTAAQHVLRRLHCYERARALSPVSIQV